MPHGVFFSREHCIEKPSIVFFKVGVLLGKCDPRVEKQGHLQVIVFIFNISQIRDLITFFPLLPKSVPLLRFPILVNKNTTM